MAGIDEAGRGAWAGPVAAGAVILPLASATLRQLRGLTDSKKLSASAREHFADLIRIVAVTFAVGWAEAGEIDAIGIVPATRLAMRRAIDGLGVAPKGLVIDAVTLPNLPARQDVFFFADSISLSVAAASVLAKTARDARMTAMDGNLPGYGFAAHKGYGTAAHAAALAAMGPCSEHRWTFRPVAALVGADCRRGLQPAYPKQARCAGFSPGPGFARDARDSARVSKAGPLRGLKPAPTIAQRSRVRPAG